MSSLLTYNLLRAGLPWAVILSTSAAWNHIDMLQSEWRVVWGLGVLSATTSIMLALPWLEAAPAKGLRRALSLRWLSPPGRRGYVLRNLPTIVTLGTGCGYELIRGLDFLQVHGVRNVYSLAHFEDITGTHGPGVWRTANGLYFDLTSVCCIAWIAIVILDFALLIASSNGTREGLSERASNTQLLKRTSPR